MGPSLTLSLTVLCASWVLYLVAVALCRGQLAQVINKQYGTRSLTSKVFFSPLGPFPGPKLAALTTWYQAYFDIWLGGQFFKEIEKLHKEYGRLRSVHKLDPLDSNMRQATLCVSILTRSTSMTRISSMISILAAQRSVTSSNGLVARRYVNLPRILSRSRKG